MMEEKKLTIYRSSRINSCNVCGNRNYLASDEITSDKYVPEIFDIQYGSMVIHLCKSCLAKLVLTAGEYLTSEEGA